jgi:hypothetical protein
MFQGSDAKRTDGYRTDDSHKFVLDDGGERAYGVWLHPDEYAEPTIIDVRS